MKKNLKRKKRAKQSEKRIPGRKQVRGEERIVGEKKSGEVPVREQTSTHSTQPQSEKRHTLGCLLSSLSKGVLPPWRKQRILP